MNEWDRQTTPGGAEGPQWVSAAEAADVAGVTPGTVRYWARNGLIVSEVVEGPGGEKTLVRLDEVLQYAPQEGPAPEEAQSGDVVTDLPARTSELAPILKSIPEIMAQLTAATDRAARAETKVEFLSAQLADLRRRLADAERQGDAAAAREAVAEVTLPEAWDRTEPPEETTPATAPAPSDARFSLDDIWTKSAASSGDRGDDPSGVDWHEPAQSAPGPREDVPSTARPANAPMPDGDDFYGRRRRRWFRRRR